METKPDLETTGEEVSNETSSPNIPDEPATKLDPESYSEEWVTPSPAPLDLDEFNRRVESLMELMEEDSKVRDRLIAETYVNFASAEMGIRGLYELVQSQGMAGLMKGAFRRG